MLLIDISGRFIPVYSLWSHHGFCQDVIPYVGIEQIDDKFDCVWAGRYNGKAPVELEKQSEAGISWSCARLQ